MAKAYFQPLKEVADDLNLQLSEYILGALLRLPDVVTPNSDSLNEQELKQFMQILQNAINELNKHRILEGDALEKDLIERINNILAYRKK